MPMETSDDARDAGQWRELQSLLGSDGIAPTAEVVRQLMARVRGDQGNDDVDRLASNL